LYKLLIICFFLFIAISCSSRKVTVPPLTSIEISKTSNPPAWYLNPRQNNELFIYGTGSGNSQEVADIHSRVDLGHFFESYVKNQTKSLMQSLEQEDEVLFSDWYEYKSEAASRLRLPGVSITRRAEMNRTFYAEAQLELRVFNNYHTEIGDRIRKLAFQGDNENNPGRKFILYGTALTLLPKTVLPVTIDGRLAQSLLNERIEKITDHIRSKSWYANDQIIVELTLKGKPFMYVPVRFKGFKTMKADANGRFVLPSTIVDAQGNLQLSVAPDQFPYPHDLNEDEIVIAKSMIESITWQLPAPPPLVKIYVRATYMRNEDDADAIGIIRALNKNITDSGLRVADSASDATYILKVDLETFLSSTNQYIGHFCKARGSVRLEGKSGVIRVFEFPGCEEKTKSAHNNLDQGLREAQRKMIILIEEQVTPYLKGL